MHVVRRSPFDVSLVAGGEAALHAGTLIRDAGLHAALVTRFPA